MDPFSRETDLPVLYVELPNFSHFRRRRVKKNQYCTVIQSMGYLQQQCRNFLLLMLLSTAVYVPLGAKTTVESTQNPQFTGVEFSAGEAKRFADDFQRMADINGPCFSQSYFLQNILGYSVGTPHITSYDIGITTGFAQSNGSYFGGSADEDSYPGITPVASIRVGKSLSTDSDILVKFMIFDMFLFNQEPEVSDVTLTDYRQFAIGGKYRYTLLGPKRLLPYLFNFSGVTCGVGADLMTASMGVTGEYDTEMEQTNIDPGTGEDKAVDTYLEGEYDAAMRLLQLSTCVEVVSYFKVFRIFDFYTGGNLTLGWNWLGITADSSGELMAADDTLDDDIGNGFDYRSDYLLELDIDSRTLFHPVPLMPVYIAGIECRISKMRIGLETAVNMYNREDVALQFALRYQM